MSLKTQDVITINTKPPPNPTKQDWVYVAVLVPVSFFVFYLSKKIRRKLENEKDESFFKQTSRVGKAR